MDLTRQPPEPKPFEFTGKSSEYFGIWIVNILLTILTLGIYSAWAKVRNNRYFYGNTYMDNASFQYLAEPLQILKGRLIAVAFLVLYVVLDSFFPLYSLVAILALLLLAPAIMVLSMSFRMRNTAWKGITFHFQRNYKQAYLIFLGPIIAIGLYIGLSAYLSYSMNATGMEAVQGEGVQSASILILILMALIGLSIPLLEYLKTCFLINNTRFGTSEFNFTSTAWGYYKIYILAFLISLVIVGIVGAIVSSAFSFSMEDGQPNVFGMVISAILITLPYIWIIAWVQTKKANLVYGNIELDRHTTESRLEVGYMMYLYITNTLAIIVSLGLLIPWAAVRTARYRASTMTFLADGNLDHFVANQQKEVNSLGEEFGEAFDIEVGL